MVIGMKDYKHSMEEHHLALVAIAVGIVIVIVVMAWAVSYYLKCTRD